jgi:hypothetical protein
MFNGDKSLVFIGLVDPSEFRSGNESSVEHLLYY